MEKRDPMLMFKSAKQPKIVNPSLKKESETSIQSNVCRWLKIQYPKLMFMSDFAAGIKLTPGMAARQSLQKSDHAFPDVIIFEPRKGYHGLFVELKRDKEALFNKNGTIKKSGHLTRQSDCHSLLSEKGYYVSFACGFDDALSVINRYLSDF